MLAEKQNNQIEREAPEIAALSLKLREMETAKEAELKRLAVEHEAQLRRKEEIHNAQLRARETTAARELQAERKAQQKKWEQEEKRRKAVRKTTSAVHRNCGHQIFLPLLIPLYY